MRQFPDNIILKKPVTDKKRV